MQLGRERKATDKCVSPPKGLAAHITQVRSGGQGCGHSSLADDHASVPIGVHLHVGRAKFQAQFESLFESAQSSRIAHIHETRKLQVKGNE